MKILIAYDNTIGAKAALNYGILKAREAGGEVVMASAFHSSMFADYDSHPSAIETAKAEWKAGLAEGGKILKDSGIKSRVVEAEGVPDDEILKIAEKEKPGLLICPPRFKHAVRKAPCPALTVPGEIIVPVDDTGSALSAIPRILAEAKASGSTVVLLGIVPVHIFGLAERTELEEVRKETASSIRKLEKALNAEGVKTEKLTREGFPDEEIIAASDDRPGSLVIIHGDGGKPSELGKAAGIIMDEPGRLRGLMILSHA